MDQLGSDIIDSRSVELVLLLVRRGLTVFLLGFTGCQLVFRLDDPTPLPAGDVLVIDDDDDDGIANDTDNCPTLANTDQLDGDDDGIGDACDGCDHCLACSVGPSHDEDGDHLADGCDNCPGTANESQVDADGDQLGDLCDPDPLTQQHRLLFWGFPAIESWVPPADWQIVGDAATPDPALEEIVRMTRFGHELVAGKPWSFEVGLELPPNVPDGKIVGVRPVADTGIGSFISCSLLSSGGAWKLSAGGQQVPTSTEAPVVLHLRANGTLVIDTTTCTIAGGATTMASQTAPGAYPLFPQLFMNPGASVRYIDVIQ